MEHCWTDYVWGERWAEPSQCWQKPFHTQPYGRDAPVSGPNRVIGSWHLPPAALNGHLFCVWFFFPGGLKEFLRDLLGCWSECEGFRQHWAPEFSCLEQRGYLSALPNQKMTCWLRLSKIKLTKQRDLCIHIRFSTITLWASKK